MMLGRKPLKNTCAIMVPSHNSPAVTCAPWQPTTAKNEDRNALRCGPSPCGDHAGEIARFEEQESQAEKPGDGERELGPDLIARIRRHLPTARR